MRDAEQNRLEAERYIGRQRKIMAEQKQVETDFYLHWHEYFEVEIILGGKGWQTLNGRRDPLHKGAVYFLTPTDFHEVFVEEPLSLYNISFDLSAGMPEFLERAVRSESSVCYPPEREFIRISQLGFLLADAFRSGIEEPEYLSGLLNCLLLRLSGLTGGREDGALTSYHPSVIRQTLLYLSLHFREHLTLSEIAAASHLSPNYLSELFRQETGKTVMQYLCELRIGYAKKLLDATGLSVTELCFACGYSSLPNFLKYFKKETGLSPLQYKKRAARSADPVGR